MICRLIGALHFGGRNRLRLVVYFVYFHL
jgi:hypothetical protein